MTTLETSKPQFTFTQFGSGAGGGLRWAEPRRPGMRMGWGWGWDGISARWGIAMGDWTEDTGDAGWGNAETETETETGMAESWRGGGTLIFNFSTMRRRLGRVFPLSFTLRVPDLLFCVFFFFCFFGGGGGDSHSCSLHSTPGSQSQSESGSRCPQFPPRSGPGLWARSAQRDEWLAKMFECDHELDLSHNLKSQSQSLSQVKSSQLDALHTRHVNQAQRHGSSSASPPSFGFQISQTKNLQTCRPADPWSLSRSPDGQIPGAHLQWSSGRVSAEA